MPKEDTFKEDIRAEYKGVVKYDFKEGYSLLNIVLVYIDL